MLIEWERVNQVWHAWIKFYNHRKKVMTKLKLSARQRSNKVELVVIREELRISKVSFSRQFCIEQDSTNLQTGGLIYSMIVGEIQTICVSSAVSFNAFFKMRS